MHAGVGGVEHLGPIQGHDHDAVAATVEGHVLEVCVPSR
jgi:hypothetical protein